MPTSKCKIATFREPLAQENETPVTRHPRARGNQFQDATGFRPDICDPAIYRDILAPDVPDADLAHVRFGSKADMCSAIADVRFVPIADIVHSITSSASASTFPGNSTPSAFAVVRLTINSNFVGCTTGKSDGFSPLRIRAA